MRLLDAKTLILKEFSMEPPPYAILSHTWDGEEVSFQDMQSPDVASKLQGYRKIRGCADLALANGYDWIWVDTCCIDKTSSAELSEAINSMFAWYRDAGVCYVYLTDVSGVTDAMLCDFYADGTRVLSLRHLISCSRWFQRGWTLQELVAPHDVEFFSADWKSLGTKAGLEVFLSEKTGIPRGALAGEPLSTYSAAEKMSWASRRITTREEDMAYCLLGIFDVHMPLLYGESNHAFVRLQEEILKRSEDLSLLAWTLPLLKIDRSRRRSVLARHPSAFLSPRLTEATLDTDDTKMHHPFIYPVQRDKLRPAPSPELQMRYPPPVVTNRGILATLFLSPDSTPAGQLPDDNTSSTLPSPSSRMSRHTLFAWFFSMAELEMFNPKLEGHRAELLIGLSLEADIELWTDGSDRKGSLRETLLNDSRPFVAWRVRAWDLLCVDQEALSRFVPHQVYLSLDDGWQLTENQTEQRQKNWRSEMRKDWPSDMQLQIDRRPEIPLTSTDMDEYFFFKTKTCHLRMLYEPLALSLPGVHVLRRSLVGELDEILSWSTVKTKLTVIKLPCRRKEASPELTRVSLLHLRIICQQEGMAGATEAQVTVELGLVRAYRRGVRRMRCAVSASCSPCPEEGTRKYEDRTYMRLECGHVLGIAVTGSWGGDPQKREDWVIPPSLKITIS